MIAKYFSKLAGIPSTGVVILILSGGCNKDEPTAPKPDTPLPSIPAPDLLSPADNSFFQSANVKLVWRDSSIFTAFHFEVATSQDFGNIDTSGTVTDTFAVVTPRSPLLWHHWRVRGRNSLDSLGLWSQARRFYKWAAYGGSGNDGGNSVQQTADGGYVVVGYTSALGAGGLDVYLFKTDSGGDTLWTRTFGGSGDDVAHSFQPTTDGGYIITGYTT